MDEEEAVAEGADEVGTEVAIQTTKKMVDIQVAIQVDILIGAEVAVVGVGVIEELDMAEAEVEVGEDMGEDVEGWVVDRGVGVGAAASKHSWELFLVWCCGEVLALASGVASMFKVCLLLMMMKWWGVYRALLLEEAGLFVSLCGQALFADVCFYRAKSKQPISHCYKYSFISASPFMLSLIIEPSPRSPLSLSLCIYIYVCVCAYMFLFLKACCK